MTGGQRPTESPRFPEWGLSKLWHIYQIHCLICKLLSTLDTPSSPPLPVPLAPLLLPWLGPCDVPQSSPQAPLHQEGREENQLGSPTLNEHALSIPSGVPFLQEEAYWAKYIFHCEIFPGKKVKWGQFRKRWEDTSCSGANSGCLASTPDQLSKATELYSFFLSQNL